MNNNNHQYILPSDKPRTGANTDAGFLIIDFYFKNKQTGQYLNIQKSIENSIRTKNYEWLTLRVENDGQFIEEQ